MIHTDSTATAAGRDTAATITPEEARDLVDHVVLHHRPPAEWDDVDVMRAWDLVQIEQETRARDSER